MTTGHATPINLHLFEWVVPEKIHTPPTQEISAVRRGGGETKLFLIIVNVLGHLKGVGGLTSNFLRGGGMDVFWNDPIMQIIKNSHSMTCCLL
jgi:hypothetical protein